MLVDTKDGNCRSCGGQLCIVDADDCSMEVECTNCGDSYPVETDAFSDGGIGYWPAFLAQQEENS